MGVVSLGIGLWLYITFNEFAAFSDGGRLLGSVFLVATGFGVIIIGFLGIVAALWESRIVASMVSCAWGGFEVFTELAVNYMKH